MPRVAFKMRLYPESHAEYEHRHNPIWTGLEEALRAHGVQRYFLFLNEAESELFGYAEVSSMAEWESIGQTEICRRWWNHMRVLMPSESDGRPCSLPLREVFRLE